MKRLIALAAALAATVALGCAHVGGGDWVTLIDGEKGLDNFNQVGDSNWHP